MRANLHILELFPGFGQDDGFNVDDVLVLEQFQQPEFPEGALGEDLMLEGLVNFFNGDQVLPLSLGFLVLGGHHDAVCALSDYIKALLLTSMISYLS